MIEDNDFFELAGLALSGDMFGVEALLSRLREKYPEKAQLFDDIEVYDIPVYASEDFVKLRDLIEVGSSASLTVSNTTTIIVRGRPNLRIVK